VVKLGILCIKVFENRAVDVTSCFIHVQTNYSYSFWRHYSSEYEYTIRTTIRQANTKQIFSASLIIITPKN